MKARAFLGAFAIFLVSGLVGFGCKKQSDASGGRPQSEFVRLMNTGKNYLDQGQAQKALGSYQQAVKLAPTDPDVHLNLANAYLRGNNAEQAIEEADEVLKLDQNSAAAYFVKGS